MARSLGWIGLLAAVCLATGCQKKNNTIIIRILPPPSNSAVRYAIQKFEMHPLSTEKGEVILPATMEVGNDNRYQEFLQKFLITIIVTHLHCGRQNHFALFRRKRMHFELLYRVPDSRIGRRRQDTDYDCVVLLLASSGETYSSQETDPTQASRHTRMLRASNG